MLALFIDGPRAYSSAEVPEPAPPEMLSMTADEAGVDVATYTRQLVLDEVAIYSVLERIDPPYLLTQYTQWIVGMARRDRAMLKASLN